MNPFGEQKGIFSMNSVIKAWQEKVLKRGAKARPDGWPSQTGAIPNGRRQTLDQMIQENNYRLWYIKRDSTLEGTLTDDELETILRIRANAEDPAYLPSVAEEKAYFEASAAAARLIGGRRPETIEVYARVERKKRWTPLFSAYIFLGISLAAALLSHGYQSAVNRQMEIMRAEREKYIEHGQTLTKDGTDMYETMSAMCQQTLRYLTAAEQLDRYLPWVETPAPDDEILRPSSTAARPGICGVLSDAVRSNMVLAPPRITDDPNDKIEERRAAYKKDKEAVLACFGEYQMMEKWTRTLLDSAETMVNLFNLLLLPALFAALGALTSSIRVADARFKAMTLSRIDQVALISRVLLGTVAGATVGIVFNASATDSLSSGLTELGLAFAFGYAVDIFFNLLDSIKSGLSANADRRPGSS